MANENFRVKNGLEVGGVLVVNSSGALVANISVGTTTVNATAIGVGSNITINTSAISVGNSTVNAVLTKNSLDIDGTITSGNLNVTGHIMPGANVTYDLGNTTMRWRDLYLSGTTIDIGGALLQTDANSGALAIIPKPTNFEPNPTATVISPQGGVVAVPTVAGVPAANAITEAAESNTASPVPIDVTTVAPANSQILVWSASANVFLPANTLLYLNAIETVKVGANLIANTTALFIGNSTVNAVLTANSLDIDGTVAVGNTTITGDLTVSGNVFFNGGTTNVNSTSLVVEDKNIILGDTDTPTDVTADGGGITLKGTTDKTLTWVDSTDAWTASENFNLVTGKRYEINGTLVANSTALGSNVTGSSLTSVGTLTGLTVSGAASLQNTLAAGNTTVTGFANISGNVYVGNSSVFWTANSTEIDVGNVTINTTAVGVGANLIANTTALFIGNSTVNTAIRSTGLSIGSNVTVNATAIQAGNSTANITIGSDTAGPGGNLYLKHSGTSYIYHGNSTVNATIASTQFVLKNNLTSAGATPAGDIDIFFGTADSPRIVLRRNNGDGTQRIPVAIVAGLGAGFDGVSTTDALRATSGTNASTTSLPNSPEFQANATLVYIGNSTVNTQITSTAIDTDGTLSVLGAATLSSTLAAGNTTVTGFVNASVSVNSSLITVGTNLIGNTTGLYHTGTVNAASHTVGASLIGNSSGLYHTGTVNAASHTTTGVTANVTGVYPASNSSGTALGAATNRWILNANTVDASGLATLSGGMNTTTANASVGINVGANVNLTTTNINVGNSTVNTAITSTAIDTDGTLAVLGAATLSSTLAAGNTTITGFANVSGNVYVGNSTVFWTANSTTINVGTTTVNTSRITVATNVVINTSAFFVGNSTVNTIVSAGSLTLNGGTIAVGNTTITGDLIVSGNVFFNGTTTNVNSTNLVVEDKNIVLGDVGTPSDTTADGGGITLKGATDKTLNWVDATDAWTSSEEFNLLTGKSYRINGAVVVNSSSLGTGVTGSSLTSVGTLTGLTVSGATSLQNTLAAGNTTITGFANVSGNVYVGNSTVFWTANSTTINVGTSSVNTTVIAAGANVLANTTAVFVGNSTVNAVLTQSSLSVVGTVNATASVNSAALTVGTSFIANTSVTRTPPTFIVSGGGATSEGGQIILGYGNNLATAPTGQANNTWNIDVLGGNTGSTPLLRVFAQNGDGTATSGFVIANTGRMHVGSLLEQTDSTFKVTGSANVTTSLTVGTTLAAGNTTITGFVNASVSVNSALITVGANVFANTSTLFVGNSTVNTVITAGNIALNGSQLTIGNSTVTTTMTGDILTVGNSTVNTVVNSTSISAAKLVANGATGTADQLLYANSTGGVYWRTPATITNVEPSNVGATSNGHVWYVYV